MARSSFVPVLAAAAALAGCTTKEVVCSPSQENGYVWVDAQGWYLYPELLPATVDTTAYATPSDLLDAITATARAEKKDRYWSFVATQAATQQYYGAGQAVGFGFGFLIRGTAPALQLLVSQVVPNSAAAGAGFSRGDEILAIGPDATHLEPVLSHLQDGTLGTLLPPPSPGQVRAFQVKTLAGDTVVRTATTRVYDLVPVPSWWTSNGVGYVSLRTFISTAEAPLRAAFQAFKSATPPVTSVVVDLRYNGGGLLSTAELLADLLGGGLAPQKMYDLLLKPARSGMDETTPFVQQPESVAVPKVAFVTTGASASASELVVNVLDPYLSVALVGGTTYGKPVGQLDFGLPCGDVLFLISFRLVNSVGHGDYYAGLPDGTTGPTGFRAPLCPAADDLTQPQGAAAEASTAAALQWLATGTCPPAPIAATALRAPSAADAYPAAVVPSPAQREIPGLF